LCDSPALLREIPLHSSDGFGHVLFSHIDRLLNDAGWQLASVDCLAVASGPGSFTGVRVGLSAAKGLADVLQRPIITVSNLAAMAAFGSLPLRAPVIDARRGEIFGGVYDSEGRPVQEEVVCKFQEWRERVPPGVEFLSFTPSLFSAHTSRDAHWTQCPRAI